MSRPDFQLGYTITSEEHPPLDLIKNAAYAEAAGFRYGLISDHFHPWIDRQGHSPFVWSVIGGISQATEGMRLGTGVTCPIRRIHPAIIAQAAATSACLLGGDRFFLGLGTGEALNEHILGQRWPAAEVRRDMLKEAIEVIRLLWLGGVQSFDGLFFNVENARLYDLPDSPVPILVASSGEKSAGLAARIADGLITTAPRRELVDSYQASGGEGPKYGQLTVCWADSEDAARRTAFEIWPNAAVKGDLTVELPLPEHYEHAAEMVSEDNVAKEVICGPDPQKHLEGIDRFRAAGFDVVFVHQVGPDQAGFLDFYQREIIPNVERTAAPARA